jgi:DNA-binding NtrC family response regulator
MLEPSVDQPNTTVERLTERVGLSRFIGQSPALLAAIRHIPAIAARAARVLIRGESGTGKELCARSIHELSGRRDGPFIPVNCATLAPALIENELFGHAPGAYTNANRAAVGLIETANEGTIFLDEIGLLEHSAQASLLRFLQSGEVRQVGSNKLRKVDVRVLAATNADLLKMVREHTFRADLYFRLEVVQINLPPLRERMGDIMLLARHFLKEFATASDPPHELSAQAQCKLESYEWPGNVRELENVIQRAMVLASEPVMGAAEITFCEAEPADVQETFKTWKAACVRRYLEQALHKHGHNISKAAKAAGMSRSAFWYLLRKHQLRSGRPSR